MIKMMRAAAATALTVAAAAVLAGCPSNGLPTGVPSGVPTGTNGATCDQSAPAGTPSTGTAALGAYNGQKLPDGWAAAYKSEAEVTAKITEFSTGNQTTWACVQSFYGGAVSVWRTKTGR